MARGTQFLAAVQMLRDELGRANSPAVGVEDLPSLRATIRHVYEEVYDASDWPHMRQVFPKIQLNAGQQHYDFPTTLNYERVEKVDVWYSGLPHPLIRGISFDEYAFRDSTTGAVSDPALNWDVRFTGVKEQIEIWPIPASQGQQLQFIGITKLNTLVDDSDVLLLDDQLVVLKAAAEILARQKSPDAQAKAQMADARFKRLTGRAKGASKTYRMGMGAPSPQEYSRAIVRVR